MSFTNTLRPSLVSKPNKNTRSYKNIQYLSRCEIYRQAAEDKMSGRLLKDCQSADAASTLVVIDIVIMVHKLSSTGSWVHVPRKGYDEIINLILPWHISSTCMTQQNQMYHHC